MRPRLAFAYQPDRTVKMLVQPHPMFSSKTKERTITADEHTAILDWQRGHMLIQEALPHWSADDRELLLTGLDGTEFHEYLKEEEE